MESKDDLTHEVSPAAAAAEIGICGCRFYSYRLLLYHKRMDGGYGLDTAITVASWFYLFISTLIFPAYFYDGSFRLKGFS